VCCAYIYLISSFFCSFLEFQMTFCYVFMLLLCCLYRRRRVNKFNKNFLQHFTHVSWLLLRFWFFSVSFVPSRLDFEDSCYFSSLNLSIVFSVFVSTIILILIGYTKQHKKSRYGSKKAILFSFFSYFSLSYFLFFFESKQTYNNNTKQEANMSIKKRRKKVLK
jgi:hypothetical protein